MSREALHRAVEHGDGGSIPLQKHREYDLPGGPHLGRAAALRVPCSEGPAVLVLDRGTPNHVLMAREPEVPPHRLMEQRAGARR